MNMNLFFSFWRKKTQKTLEEILSNVKEVRQEFQQHKTELNNQINTQREEFLKREEKLREELSQKKVLIHYYPGKELFVIIDGEIIHSDVVTPERFEQLKKLREEKNVAAIYTLLVPAKLSEMDVFEEQVTSAYTDLEKEEEVLEVIEKIGALTETGDFEVKNGSVYLKGIKRSIPLNLVNRFEKLAFNFSEDAKEEYEALKNYWRWIVLNPNVKAIEEFYRLVETYNVKVTKEGFILAFRWVLSLDDEPSISQKGLEFITGEWAKVKKAKKGVKNYEVYFDPSSNEYFSVGFGKFPKDRNVNAVVNEGNLDELYSKIGEMQPKAVYTDGRTQKMKIRIGEEVSMNRKDCDESGESCSRGLHGAFNIKDYSSHGNTKLLIAICPRDIVSVPYHESKFRFCRYLPLAVLGPKDDDTTFFQEGEGLDLLEDYLQLKVDELKTQAETQTVTELTRHRIIPVDFVENFSEEDGKDEINNIVSNFQNILDNRIKPLS